MIIPQGNEIWYCAKFKFAETTKTKKSTLYLLRTDLRLICS